MGRGEIRRKAELYDETAWMYDKRYGYQQSLKHAAALSELPVGKKDVVADLGCGTGDLLKKIKNLGGLGVGFDFSLKMLLEARRKHPDLDFVLADVHRLPLKPSSCSKVFAVTLLQNVNVNVFLEELARICRPHGQALLSSLAKVAEPFIQSILKLRPRKIFSVDEDIMAVMELQG